MAGQARKHKIVGDVWTGNNRKHIMERKWLIKDAGNRTIQDLE